MTATAHQVRVLCDKEEELVHVLSVKDPVEVANNLYRKCIISDTMRDQFVSLDHSRVEPQLQIRYLLRLARKQLEEDNTVWGKFLNLLAGMGASFNTMRVDLQEQLDKNTAGVEVYPPTTTASGEADIILTTADAEDLTELLAEKCHKWELLAIALKLPECVREKCRGLNDDIIRLNKVITHWLSGDSNTPTTTTLHTLKKALGGPIVKECNVCSDLEERFRPVKRARLSLLSEIESPYCSNPTVINQSDNTEVGDGQSTLLLVQASPRQSVSYQWKKNGQHLATSSTYSGVSDDILVVSHARQGTEGEYTCHVSSEGKEVCSNKIILTVEYPPIKKRLLDLYSVSNEVPSDSWPPSGTRTFINLVLIKSSKEPTDVTDYSVGGNADEVTAEKEKVEYEQVFGKCKCGELILLEGRPGSGKTTLVHKIIKDWTRGHVLVNARWVMLITLRDLNNTRAETLTDILGLFCHSEETVAKNIEKDSGEGLCFVIDGLDEYQPQDKKKSPIYQLLNKAILPKAMVIVSSRPAATKDLKWEKLTKRIEVLGFTREQVLEYIDCFPFGSPCSDSDKSNTSSLYPVKLKEYLYSHPNIFHMCYLPVLAGMICFLFKSKGGHIPITRTKIYEEFTRCIILRHLTRSNCEAQLTSLQDLSGNTKIYFSSLCRLAFEMTINSKQVVIPQELEGQQSETSLPEDTKFLGLVTISHTAKLSGFHSTYTFLHLTFQEYLAAVYVSSLDVQDQMMIIEKHSSRTMLLTMWTFYCGLVDFSNGVERLRKIFIEPCYSRKHSLHFAFESQQPAVCDYLVRLRYGRFTSPLRFVDIPALGYVIGNTSLPVTELSPIYCDESTALLQALEFNKEKLHNLQVLDIYNICLNGAHVTLLTSVIKACTRLTRVGLCLQNIDSDSMSCLLDRLTSLFHLKHLTILCVGSTPGAITVLLDGLQHLIHVDIELRFAHLRISDVVELGRGSDQLTINGVRKLKLHYSSISVEGASALASGLPKLTKLEHLDLSHNNIDDDGVTSLAIGINHIYQLPYLVLSYNNIGPCGATSLASAIACLKNLTHLNLEHNNIGPEGATSLAAALQHLRNLGELNLSHNSIGPEGATSLAAALQHLRNLRELNLSCNSIGPEGAISVANALHHLEKLIGLNLSSNNIDLASATAIVTALKNCLLLHYTNINIDERKDRHFYGFWCTIQMRGLVATDNAVTIAALVAAVQHDTRCQVLDLGFDRINVPPKSPPKSVLESRLFSFF